MKQIIIAWMALGCAPIFAAKPAPGVAKSLDEDLANIEGEIVPLAAEMPAAKYSFAPTDGEFKGVRTFGQQVKHVATVLYAVSAAILGEKNPIALGTDENGPAAVQSKDEIVKYLKDAFAYAHKATGSLTEKNVTGMVASPFGSSQAPRMKMATMAVSHSFDHYGQMVVYARMNGMAPPASRR
jgi:uncharacterized damage-inducible protein DinB